MKSSSERPKPHSICYTDEVDRRLTKIAAIMDIESNSDVWWNAFLMYEKFSQHYVRNKPWTMFVSEKLGKVMEENPEFFDALAEEGVVEWLSPLVLSEARKDPE